MTNNQTYLAPRIGALRLSIFLLFVPGVLLVPSGQVLAVQESSSTAMVVAQLVRQFTIRNTVSTVGQGLQGFTSEVNGHLRAPPMGPTAAGFPAGVGTVPSGYNLSPRDGGGRVLGYCAWDNSTATASATYFGGAANVNKKLFALISPGLDGTMETDCAHALNSTIGAGDDYMIVVAPQQSSSSQFKSSVGTLTTLNATPGQQGDIRLVEDSNQLYAYRSGSWQALKADEKFDDDPASGAGAITYTTGKVTVAEFQATAATLTGNLTVGGAATVTGALTANGGLVVNGGLSVNGAVSATSLAGDGSAITQLNASNFTSGVMGPGFGGTGVNASAAGNGTLLIGNGSGFSLAQLTAGMGMGVMNTAGGITLNNTGVLSLAGTANQVNVSATTGAITLSLPQAISTNSAPTFANLTVTGTVSAQRYMTDGRLSFVAGPNTMPWVTTGTDNIAIGNYAMFANSSGYMNIALNASALYNNTEGAFNVALGRESLLSNTTGNYNTGVGSFTNVSSNNLSYATVLGAGGAVSTSNTVVLGRTSDSTVIGATGTASSGILQNKKLQVTGDVGISGNMEIGGAFTAASFSGNGSALTNLNANNIATGTLAVARGGTGLGTTPTNGQLLIGNGTGYTLASLAGTANQVNVANAAGSITLSLPQAIATTSAPTFGGMTLNGGLTANAGITVNNSTINFNNILGNKLNLWSGFGFGINGSNLNAYIPSASERFSLRVGGSGFDGTEVFTVAGNGNVGVTGTLNVSSTAVVNGSANTPGLTSNTNGSQAWGVAALLRQTVVSNSDGPKLEFYKPFASGGANWTVGIQNGVDNGNFVISNGAGTVSSGFGTPRLTVDPSGNTSITGTFTSNGNTVLNNGNLAGYTAARDLRLYASDGFASWDHLRIRVDGSGTNIDAGGAESGLRFRVGATSSGDVGGQTYNTVLSLFSDQRATFAGNVTVSGTTTMTGAVTANAGVSINNSQLSFNDVLGDKIRLWNTVYGFGIQGSNLAAFMPNDARFSVRNGGTSTGTEVFTVSGAGHGSFAGNLAVGGTTSLTGALTGSTGSFTGSLTITTGNVTGGGLVLGDDGDIVDLNDGFASMRFSNGVKIFSTKSGGSEVTRFTNTGQIFSSYYSFLADGDTGIYSAGDGRFAVNANGAKVMEVNTGSNVAIGISALSNATGGANIGIGRQAGQRIGAGGGNVMIGDDALVWGSGNNSTAIGAQALFNSTGSANVGIGNGAISGLHAGGASIYVYGHNNTAVGYFALRSLGNGSDNLALGRESGVGVGNGSNNSLLGAYSDVLSSGIGYATAVGSGSRVGTSNTVVLGRTTDVTVIGSTNDDGSGNRLQVTGSVKATAFNTTSDRRLKNSIAQLNADDQLSRLRQLSTYQYRFNNDPTGKIFYGVIAQEVAPLFPHAVRYDANGIMSVDYGALGAMAASAVGHLAGKVEVLEVTMQKHRKDLDTLQTAVADLEAWRTGTTKKLTTIETALEKNTADIAKNALDIATNTRNLVRLEEVLLDVDDRLSKQAEQLDSVNKRIASWFTHDTASNTLQVNVNLQVGNFTALQLQAQSVYAQRLDAEIARIKSLEVERLRAGEVNTGAMQAYAGPGLPASLFTAQADGHYTVNVSSSDGSYATATVIVSAGVARVVPLSSEGIDLFSSGNQIKAAANGKNVKASWIKTG